MIPALIIILSACVLCGFLFARRSWLVRRRKARELSEPQPKPPKPPRAFILKIVEMIEKGDYSYTANDPLLGGHGHREVYKFALRKNLKCEVARTINYAAQILGGTASAWWLYVDGLCESMTLHEQDAIADALTKLGIARRERERLEQEAKRAPIIAAIEAYTVVDRRTK